MRCDKVIRLVSETIEPGSRGEQNKVPGTERVVLGAELKVGVTEHYAAAAMDIRPDVKLEIYTREYKGEPLLKYKGVSYRVIRTSADGERTQLICERRLADVELENG